MSPVARDEQTLIGDVESGRLEGDVELLLKIPAGNVLR
jgi:hypothetical protein